MNEEEQKEEYIRFKLVRKTGLQTVKLTLNVHLDTTQNSVSHFKYLSSF